MKRASATDDGGDNRILAHAIHRAMMNEQRRICDALPESVAAPGKLVQTLQGREADGHTLIAFSLQELGINHLRLTFTFGEPLTGSLVDRWRALGACGIISIYGPTEPTTAAGAESAAPIDRLDEIEAAGGEQNTDRR